MLKEQFYLSDSWKKIIGKEFEKEYFRDLEEFIQKEYNQETIHPIKSNIFKALNTTPFNKVKVVILGQDPYHSVDQANGLAFSVNSNIAFPPSLRNIFKEVANDLNISKPSSGELNKWAEQGVLLLNTTLTVRSSSPGSHQKKGWEKFTDVIIKNLSDRKKGIIFLIWGKEAEKKKHLIDLNKHHILISSHPSPLSAHKGFLGCKHFSKTNEILISNGKKPIDWEIL